MLIMFNTQTIEQAKADFDRDGYAVMRQAIPADTVALWTERMERYIREVLPTLGPEFVLYEDKDDPRTLFRLERVNQHDAFFDQLFQSEEFISLAGVLLDDQIVPRYAELLAKAPRVGNVTPAHQDGYYFMLEPNEAVTFWIPIDSVDEENGCLAYVPGSHKHGIRPHGKSEVLGFSQGILDYGDGDAAKEVMIHAEPGDVVVHHSVTIHRAGRNDSERLRRAIGLVYFAQRAKHDQEGSEAYSKQLFAEWAESGKI